MTRNWSPSSFLAGITAALLFTAAASFAVLLLPSEYARERLRVNGSEFPFWADVAYVPGTPRAMIFFRLDVTGSTDSESAKRITVESSEPWGPRLTTEIAAPGVGDYQLMTFGFDTPMPMDVRQAKLLARSLTVRTQSRSDDPGRTIRFPVDIEAAIFLSRPAILDQWWWQWGSSFSVQPRDLIVR